MKKTTAAMCVLAAALTMAAGCDSVGKTFSPKHSKADIDLDGDVITIESSSDQHSQDGVSHLRAEQWADAVREFNLAVTDNPKDDRSLKGLGVAYEKMGDKAHAYDAYSRANLIILEPDPILTRKLRDLKPQSFRHLFPAT